MSPLFYSLPSGKNYLYSGSQYQSSQKGSTCGYYALNKLRNRIGPIPVSASALLKRARHNEILCSVRRKCQTVLDQQFGGESQGHIDINKRFLSETGTFDIDAEITRRKLGTAWERMPVEIQCRVLDNMVFHRMCALYELSYSKWDPTNTPEVFFNELKECGPLLIKGLFGSLYYKDAPTLFKDKALNRPVYGWLPGAQRLLADEVIHSIVVVGLRLNEEEPLKSVVYFVDPNDPSDPEHPEKDKLYAMSYGRMQKSIFNLNCEQCVNSEDSNLVYMPGPYAVFRPGFQK